MNAYKTNRCLNHNPHPQGCRADDSGFVRESVELLEQSILAFDRADSLRLAPAVGEGARTEPESEPESEGEVDPSDPTTTANYAALRAYLDLRLVHLYHDGAGDAVRRQTQKLGRALASSSRDHKIQLTFKSPVSLPPKQAISPTSTY